MSTKTNALKNGVPRRYLYARGIMSILQIALVAAFFYWVYDSDIWKDIIETLIWKLG